jgi:YbgC/YbaW family acyl-CoA thioester hydrolase
MPPLYRAGRFAKDYARLMRTSYAATISLGDTDSAGVLFYARLFELVQRAFEAHLTARGLALQRCFDEGIIAPVVHAEADYRAPLRLGDAVTVETSVESIGDSSVRMAYIVRLGDGTLAAEALVVHVCVGEDGRSVPVSEKLRRALEG